MKKISLLFISLLWMTFSPAQNLVTNPSFELYDTCPDFMGQLDRCTQWFQPSAGTPDYFNACYDTTQDVYSYAGIPGNILGRQTPRSGRAYAGAFFEFNEQDYREYCEIVLTAPLQIGTQYFVSFYVSLADSAKRATDVFSAYFSVDTLKQIPFTYFPVVPDINNAPGNFITNETSWTKVSGSFVADSAYRFLTIGNFKDDLSTSYIYVPGGSLTIDYDHAYYFIDDVCVSTDSLNCVYTTGVGENLPKTGFSIYPNPANQSATLEFNNPEKENCTLALFDSHGKLVQTITNITTNKVEIERQDLADGLYYFQLYTDEKIIADGKMAFE